MRRYLIVANQTLGGEALQEAVLERMRQGPATFYVIVPATRPADYSISAAAMYGGMLGMEGFAFPPEASGEDRAAEHLAAALRRLSALGADADGEVGDPDPVEAVRVVLERRSFDEIILSTLPSGISRWLRMDLLSRMTRRFDLPITHVVVTADDGIREE